MHKLPKIRENLLVQDLADEILIYDLSADKMFCLNSTARTVFNACDGNIEFAALKIASNLTDEIIHLSLDELKKQNLLADDYASPFIGLNRREVIKKVGLSTMFALPVITARAAPTAAQTASNCVALNEICIPNNFTQSNCCAGQRCGATFSRCIDCYPQGTSFTTLANPDQATCNARPERNYCCNPTANATANGSNCLCG